MNQLSPGVQKLIDEWKEDCKIGSDLSLELAKVYQLQAKYLDGWNLVKQQIKVLELELDRLQLAKFNHYAYGPTPETKNWEYPASGKILRQDVSTWVDADKEIQEKKLVLNAAKSRFDTLTYVLDTLKYRTNTISSLMKYEMWKSGS